ncbi:MAG TPA: YdeI/OmpD-associated family protein [Longimicrobiaceae bacterium]|nr:YdeI/OmpD-associated family protein [Longimicrobiaceae bacterium]
MGTRHPGVDAYIAKAPEFARPILTYLREVVHEACPPVEEALKWSAPFFEYKGILCSMAAFKQHCAFGFWKGSLFVSGQGGGDEAMGQFGRLTSVDDLPPREVLAGYVREAMRLNEEGVKSPTRSKEREPKAALPVPDDLEAALRASEAARIGFEGFNPSQRREYIEWITDAKSPETRRWRLETAVEWMAEGKPRHWKYAKK